MGLTLKCWTFLNQKKDEITFLYVATYVHMYMEVECIEVVEG